MWLMKFLTSSIGMPMIKVTCGADFFSVNKIGTSLCPSVEHAFMRS